MNQPRRLTAYLGIVDTPILHLLVVSSGYNHPALGDLVVSCG